MQSDTPTETAGDAIDWLGPDGSWLPAEIVAPWDDVRVAINVDGAIVVAHRARIRSAETVG